MVLVLGDTGERPMKTLQRIAWLLLVPWLGSCGAEEAGSDAAGAGSPGSVRSPAGSDIDVCSLIDDTQVAGFLGQAVPGQAESATTAIRSCQWQIVEDGRARELVLELTDAGDAATARSGMATFREFRDVQDEIDLGDESFLAGYSLDGLSVVIRADADIVEVSTSEGGKAAQLQDLAADVLDRL
jgi:hypothetical protein